MLHCAHYCRRPLPIPVRHTSRHRRCSSAQSLGNSDLADSELHSDSTSDSLTSHKFDCRATNCRHRRRLGICLSHFLPCSLPPDLDKAFRGGLGRWTAPRSARKPVHKRRSSWTNPRCSFELYIYHRQPSSSTHPLNDSHSPCRSPEAQQTSPIPSHTPMYN